MAMRGFNAIPENTVHASENRKYPAGWQEGIDAFRRKDFEKAMVVFMSVPLNEDTTMADIARWNILLCQLAMNGPSNEWLADLNAFSKNAPDPMRAEAKKLLRVVHSSLFNNLFKGNLHKTFTSVKPKII
jgi:hypothetical protein